MTRGRMDVVVLTFVALKMVSSIVHNEILATLIYLFIEGILCSYVVMTPICSDLVLGYSLCLSEFLYIEGLVPSAF